MQHKFVEFMPGHIQEGIIYISPEYGTVIHLCACGCGEEVNTPLSPTGWKLTYDGKNIALDPSIGNWNFDCRSHYWIKNNEVVWAENWSDTHVKYKRDHDRKQSDKYYRIGRPEKKGYEPEPDNLKKEPPAQILKPFWKRVLGWFGL